MPVARRTNGDRHDAVQEAADADAPALALGPALPRRHPPVSSLAVARQGQILSGLELPVPITAVPGAVHSYGRSDERSPNVLAIHEASADAPVVGPLS